MKIKVKVNYRINLRNKKLKFDCLEVSDFTDSPEILEGRVKTLHPKIHAGILNKRNNKTHLNDLKKK